MIKTVGTKYCVYTLLLSSVASCLLSVADEHLETKQVMGTLLTVWKAICLKKQRNFLRYIHDTKM